MLEQFFEQYWEEKHLQEKITGTDIPVVETMVVTRIVPTRPVGTAVPIIIVLTACFWKSFSPYPHSRISQ